MIFGIEVDNTIFHMNNVSYPLHKLASKSNLEICIVIGIVQPTFTSQIAIAQSADVKLLFITLENYYYHAVMSAQLISTWQHE